MEQIRTFFEQLQPLSDEEWYALREGFERVEFTGGESLVREGQQCDFIGFMREGLVRFYHLKNGTEKVTAFWFAGDFISNYRSFLTRQPSDHHIEAITSGFYWRLRRNNLYALYDEYPVIDRLGRLMAERLYLMVTQRLDDLLQDTPEERYRQLLARNSKLIQEIPQFMLASYLGVSPETLSRIRKRIASSRS